MAKIVGVSEVCKVIGTKSEVLTVGSGGIRDLDNFLTLPKYLSNIAIFVVRDTIFSQKAIPAMKI